MSYSVVIYRFDGSVETVPQASVWAAAAYLGTITPVSPDIQRIELSNGRTCLRVLYEAPSLPA